MSNAPEIERISQELISLLGTDQQVEPFSRRYPCFDLEEAYEIVVRVGELRNSRGEMPIGRKIGFTNRSIWRDLGISAPIWNYVFDRTVSNAVSGHGEANLGGMPEPRIEPEIVLHLASAPAPGMTISELAGCIDWVAPGFEVVYSIFPDWNFTAADAAAAYGVHGALVVGEKLAVTRPWVEAQLSRFRVELESDKGVCRTGHASNVLGGPVEALKFLVEEIARHPKCEPLRPGELVTTGTLTEAMPARTGDSWAARFEGIGVSPLQIHFV
jgi:2-oxo-3-hexenedioate decarboxylase